MQLLLQLDTNSDIDAVLSIAYGFDPPYQFKHVGNGVLEATIDASHPFTDAQWTIIAASKYTVTFVIPTPTPAS